MDASPTILIVDDDEGHALLVRESLEKAGLGGAIQHFRDGQAILDFLLRRGGGPVRQPGRAYLLLLDIRMPKVDGVEVLRQVKAHPELRKLPVVILSTTDDPQEVARCHEFGCNVYLVKPMDFDRFTEAVKRLGHLIRLAQVPPLDDH